MYRNMMIDGENQCVIIRCFFVLSIICLTLSCGYICYFVLPPGSSNNCIIYVIVVCLVLSLHGTVVAVKVVLERLWLQNTSWVTFPKYLEEDRRFR